MRLIDADALYEKLQNNSSYDLDFFDAELRQIIEGAPTAYDVDAVVKELEKATVSSMGGVSFNKNVMEVIEIVRKGGAE